MAKDTKRERADYISQRSHEMAQSGEYKDWRSIEMALRAEGYEEARQLLDSRFLRQELNETCKAAMQRKSEPK